MVEQKSGAKWEKNFQYMAALFVSRPPPSISRSFPLCKLFLLRLPMPL